MIAFFATILNYGHRLQLLKNQGAVTVTVTKKFLSGYGYGYQIFFERLRLRLPKIFQAVTVTVIKNFLAVPVTITVTIFNEDQ